MDAAKRKAKNLLVYFFNELSDEGLTLDEHDEIESIVDLLIAAAVNAVKLEQIANLTPTAPTAKSRQEKL